MDKFHGIYRIEPAREDVLEDQCMNVDAEQS